MYIERPKGLDISDDHVTLTLRDENGLRAGTVLVRVRVSSLVGEVVSISVERVPEDQNLRVEFATVN
jgi:hypothetical protein